MSADSLKVELRVPVAWQPLAASPDAAALAGHAVRALQTAVTLGEKPTLIPDEATGMELELARLQQKTQLLIELLAVALGRDGVRPAAQAVRLGSEHCEWASDQAEPLGTQGLLSLWLHPASPEPLQWPAEISSSAPGAVCARLLPLSEAAQVALERHVFLLHRRAVAEARAGR